MSYRTDAVVPARKHVEPCSGVIGSAPTVLPRPLYHLVMPGAGSEREAWRTELAALPAQIAEYHRALDGKPTRSKQQRELLWWLIRRDQMRIAELQKKLARADEGGVSTWRKPRF